jgi:chromosome segregation ATPase
MADGVPQWLLDNLASLDRKVSKTNEQLETVINLMNDLRVKEATLQTKIAVLDRHTDDIEELKKKEAQISSDIALIKQQLTGMNTSLTELKSSQTHIQHSIDEAKLNEVRLNTRMTIYVGLISVVGAGAASVIFSLLTKFFGG